MAWIIVENTLSRVRIFLFVNRVRGCWWGAGGGCCCTEHHYGDAVVPGGGGQRLRSYADAARRSDRFMGPVRARLVRSSCYDPYKSLLLTRAVSRRIVQKKKTTRQKTKKTTTRIND